jgi:hypothetical protein
MILPKGIVINTDSVYKEVENFTVVPIEKIWQYWHVYTTTNKKLKDPTARRLENFWWHVLGSKCRFLSGRTLARLYEDISLAPSFVPLRGPANRWEGPDVQDPALEQPRVSEPLSKSAADLGKVEVESSLESASPIRVPLKSLSNSASKPPPSHPILKKPRGPSSTGPRPTARFADFQDPAPEDDAVSESASSGSTAIAVQDAPPVAQSATATAPSPNKKKSHGTGRKFVASKATSKRRPVLQRRPSSQSSTASESASRDAGSSVGSRVGPVPARAVSPIPEAASNQVSPDSRHAPSELTHPSAKALGKRPAMPQRTHSDIKVSSTSSKPLSAGQPAAPSSHRSSTSLSTMANENASNARDARIAPPMIRSLSSHDRYKDWANGRSPAQGLFTGATASTTPVAAQGTIIDQSGGVSPISIDSRSSYHGSNYEGADYPGQRRPMSSLLESRLTPTQPSPTMSVPLGRTRSQLTLLLEREKARVGDKPKSKS